MILSTALFMAGVALLVAGAWLLIGGGTRMAAVLGVPPVVVGLTVVAFGTSAPELFVSLMGALRGNTGLVLGNVVGSNVANLGLILALAAILRPVIVEKGLVRREVPFMLVATAAFTVLVVDGVLSRVDALLLTAGLVVFLVWTIRTGGQRGSVLAPAADLSEPEPGHRLRELAKGLGLVVLGVGGLAGGGQLIVGSAMDIALRLGVSETLIGLTLVAVGTSLPELATTVMAAWKDQDDLALGNIVGSNLFNLLGVAGPVGLVQPLRQQAGQGPLQLIALCLVTGLVYVMIVMRGGRIGRARGWALLLIYFVVNATWMVSR